MADIQLWAKGPSDTNFTLLDLFEAEPIKLTLSVANIEDPLAAESVFSRTFRVPHTSINGPFFKAVFNVNSTNFDASKKAEAYINDTGQFFAIGNVRLMSIYTNSMTENIEYEINFYGETSDFGSKIGGGFLNEVDLSQYDHTLNYTNITNSWTGNLFGGDVVYPLIEWGYTYSNGQPQQSTLSVFSGPGSVAGFTTSSNPLAWGQMKPTLRAKALWDAIFAETGYTYSSTFLEGADFAKMYIIAENIAQPVLDTSLKFEAELSGTDPLDFYPGTTSQMFFSTEMSDPSNSYNSALSIYTAKAAGPYAFDINADVEFGGNPAATRTFVFRIVDVDTLVPLASSSPITIYGGTPTNVNPSLAFTLTVGQRVKLEIEVFGGGSTPVSFFFGSYYATVAPSIFSISSLMPSNIRKIDLMRSIINRFRLVFEPSKDNEKHFTITPWKDWILGGAQKDWTRKLDGSKDMKISPLFYGQSRLQVYKDQEDADFPNYNYQLSYKQTFGQRNQDSNNELIKGEKVTLDQFAMIPLLPIGNTQPGDAGYNFLIPHLAKDTNTERQPIQPKLRLAYYNGLQPAPVSWYLYQGGMGAPSAQTQYPLMSQYSSWPPTGTTFDLAWENEPPLWNTELTTLPTARTSYDTFNVYWKTWYDTVFDPYSRIVEANFVLDYDDIYNLRFNDYIYVKDAWYFVNKVSDYIAGQMTNCRVQLVKVGNNIGLTIPPTDTSYRAESLCYDTESVCAAFCCDNGPQTFYISGIDLSSSLFIYNDPYGSIVAAPGYYSDGVVVAIVGTGGAIISFANTSSCNCDLGPLTAFTVCIGDTSCQACCCESGTTTVYGEESIFENNLTLYKDLAGTPADPLYYRESPSGTDALQVGRDGEVIAFYTCEFCDCEGAVLNPIVVDYYDSESAPCITCCDAGVSTTVYGNGATLLSSTILYYDNSGLSPVGAGYWKDSAGVIAITDGSGNITGYVDCTSCICDYYYKGENCNSPGLYADFSSPTPLNVGDVVSSATYPGECWTIFEFATSGYPIDNIYVSCDACTGSGLTEAVVAETTSQVLVDATWMRGNSQVFTFQTAIINDGGWDLNRYTVNNAEGEKTVRFEATLVIRLQTPAEGETVPPPPKFWVERVGVTSDYYDPISVSGWPTSYISPETEYIVTWIAERTTAPLGSEDIRYYIHYPVNFEPYILIDQMITSEVRVYKS